MPQFNEILNNRVSKFVKRSYRPWDLSGTLDLSIKEDPRLDKNVSESDLQENRTQTKHEVNTNQTRSENSLINKEISAETKPTGLEPTKVKLHKKPNTNQTQIEHNLDTSLHTNKTQLNEQKFNEKEITHKSNTKSYTLTPNNQTQTAHKLDTNTSFASLSGIQRDIVILIFNHCKMARQEATNEISISYISLSLNIRSGSVKTSLVRLEQKNFISRLEYKVGRGGWSRYKLSDSLYSELLYLDKTHKLDTNNTQIEHKLNTESYTEQYTTLPSSSSLKQSTTKEEGKGLSNTIELPLDWQAIDFTSLEFIGFNLNKLQQIYQAQADNFTAEMIQNSLYAFAFDMEVNNIIYKSPINFIMSQLKVKGIPYDFPANYESPRIRAMRLYQERLAAHTQRETELRDNLKRSCFDTWLATVPMEEQNKLIPKGELYTKDGPRRGALFNYFEQNIWPDKEKAILAGMSA